ncbi:hypothetical protein [Microcoleus sp. S13_C3]|uniref:hypothetical protein n=1 Tax=Microcoleus sp. S13_C3 TaxID=3055409 RepID=UPI002FD6CF6B
MFKQSTVNTQQSTVNSQQSTVNTQQSTVNSQHSTVNSQHSTLNSHTDKVLFTKKGKLRYCTDKCWNSIDGDKNFWV